METSQIISDVQKSTSKYTFSSLISFIAVSMAIFVLCGFGLRFIGIEKYNVEIGYLSLIVVSCPVISFILHYYYFFRPSVIKKNQKEYLQNLYDNTMDEMEDTASSLIILRSVPEIAEAVLTEEEHLDLINKNIEELNIIQLAAKELNIELE
jgi:uncharacterized membrane protein YukC